MADEQPTPAEAPDSGVGEGGGTSADGFYDLSGVAPEIRPVVESHLKAIQGRITPKLQEAAEYRKQWEPYEELGLNDTDPDEIAGLLSFAELTQAAAAGDQQALAQFSDWYDQIGDQFGFLEDPDEVEPGEEDYEETPDVQEAVTQAVAPIYQQMQQQQQEQLFEKTLGEIQDQTNKLQQEQGLSDEDMDTVLRFAQSYDEEADPIAAGFKDFQALIARGEKGLFDKKFAQSQPPEGAGPADNSASPITDFKTASLMARERIHNQ